MVVDWHQVALLGLMSAGLHWLVARSTIARPLWSRARGKLAELLACPACSGWWIGIGLWVAGIRPVCFDWMCTAWLHAIACIAVNALLGLVLTPVVEAVLLWGLERSAIQSEPSDES